MKNLRINIRLNITAERITKPDNRFKEITKKMQHKIQRENM